MNPIEKETSVRPDASINSTPRRRQARKGLLTLALGCALLATVGAAPAMASFGITSFSNTLTNQDTTADTQAGSHPYDMTTSMTFTQQSSGAVTDNVKDVAVRLPPGLIGNPNATPKCPVTQLDSSSCPAATQVGELTITINLGGGNSPISAPLYNLVPPAGMAAQFGANILVVNTYLDVSVRTGADYGLTTTSSNISDASPCDGYIGDAVGRRRRSRTAEWSAADAAADSPDLVHGTADVDAQRRRVAEPRQLHYEPPRLSRRDDRLRQAVVQPVDHRAAGHDRRGFARRGWMSTCTCRRLQTIPTRWRRPM